MEQADRILSKEGWTLKLHYFNKGQRNEGIEGMLLYNGKIVRPQRVHEVIHTALGDMKYYLNPEDRRFPFEFTGWNFADSNQILNSWD